MADGLVGPWREKDRLYLFAGRHVYEMVLPIDRGNRIRTNERTTL